MSPFTAEARGKIAQRRGPTNVHLWLTSAERRPAPGIRIEIGHCLSHCYCRLSVRGVEEVIVGPECDTRVGVAKATGNRAYTNSLSRTGGGEVAKSVERHIREAKLVSKPDECRSPGRVGTARTSQAPGTTCKTTLQALCRQPVPAPPSASGAVGARPRRRVERDPARLVRLYVLLGDDLSGIRNRPYGHEVRQVDVEDGPPQAA